MSIPELSWLVFTWFPSITIAYVLIIGYSHLNANRMQDDLFRLLAKDRCANCGYSKGYIAGACPDCGKTEEDSKRRCADRIIKYVSGAPDDALRKAMSPEQYAAVMQHASDRKRSRAYRFATKLGWFYIHILLAAPVVLITTVVLTTSMPVWASRVIAGVVGTIVIGAVVTAFVFRKIADDDLRNETNRKL